MRDFNPYISEFLHKLTYTERIHHYLQGHGHDHWKFNIFGWKFETEF